VLRVRCVGMNMWARPGASNGASTHRSAQASRTRSGMRYIHTHIHTSFQTERFSRVDALLDSLPHEFDEGIGGGAVHPLKEPSALALCCLSFGCSCAGPARRRAVASPHMHACKHTRWHILTRAALHRFAHEYLLPSTCLSSGLRAFTRLCFPTHACVRSFPSRR
jgi:hypothetical protein